MMKIKNIFITTDNKLLGFITRTIKAFKVTPNLTINRRCVGKLCLIAFVLMIVVCTPILFWKLGQLYVLESLDMQVETIAMEVPEVIAYVKHTFLDNSCSVNETPYVTYTLVDGIYRTQGHVLSRLEYQMNGFFIEVNAYDGEASSNSLVLVRQFNWTGLIIEADPRKYRDLVDERKMTILSPSCLSTKPFPQARYFPQKGKIERLRDVLFHSQYSAGDAYRTQVQCFPLYTYLLALERTTIDYLSLDVNGDELEVLETIPWEKVNIRVLTVKHYFRQGKTLFVQFVGDIQVPSSKFVLEKYMERMGYAVFVRYDEFWTTLYFFTKEF